MHPRWQGIAEVLWAILSVLRTNAEVQQHGCCALATVTESEEYGPALDNAALKSAAAGRAFDAAQEALRVFGSSPAISLEACKLFSIASELVDEAVRGERGPPPRRAGHSWGMARGHSAASPAAAAGR